MRSDVSIERALATESCSGWLTPAHPGRFPLVLIGSGVAGRAYYHARLAEELAAAGFVVAFVSGLGPTAESTPGFDPRSVETLKKDAVRALDALAADERVDPTRVGLAAWSVSGVVQLAIARDVPAVRAAVSLDSGVGYNYGPPMWAGVAAGPPRTMPYLHLGAGVRSPVPTDDSLLRQIDADVRVVGPLSHAQFTDLPAPSNADTRAAQAAMRRTVVDFLVAHVTR
jgi:dienelactone hydrolase